MDRLFVAFVVFVGFVPSVAQAVDISNIRVRYGPFGAIRAKPGDPIIQCLPADTIFMTFDIEDLQLDAKTGRASYDTILELLDSEGKVKYEKKTQNDVLPHLGGSRMPGDLYLSLGAKQAAGSYSVRLKVIDKLAKEGKGKQFTYPFEVIKPGFGFIQTTAPALGVPGGPYLTTFGLVNLGLDAKKNPDAEVSIRILDDKGVAVRPAVKIQLPAEMPAGVDLAVENFVPLSYPVFLNRPGRYTIEVSATDKIGAKTAKMSYSLNVLDLNSVAGK